MYKDLLVEIDERELSSRRIDYAIRLSRHFGAHLTGLHLIASFIPPPAIGSHLTYEMEARLLAGERERSETALDRFPRRGEGGGYRRRAAYRERPAP